MKTITISIIFAYFIQVGFCNPDRKDLFRVKDGYTLATIHFIDSTSIQGYAKIIDMLGSSTIKFKLTEDGKPDSWNENDLKGVTMHSELMDIVFHYVKLKNYSNPKLVELVEHGEISVYAKVDSNWVDNSNSNSTSIDGLSAFVPSHREVSYQLFVIKDNEQEAISLGKAINFKKIAKEYFKNCPGIINKIDEMKFKIGDVLEMVQYYNDFCAEL
ncbi:hypothetical protein M0G43_03960 [Subsaxibacter sp. CAU 1640]|uniref:hypothetical protein n=1 Tax=Subsaxibacter sp. CAU 1640 TaxID=2933271 RepID=UPI002003C376|nr:hypothetical protein [Subsaxibacter sp. CAU 1640]MCK7589719.1 hypothetical protein [Subsaxibacter sp. CAU 1640]